MDKEFESGEAIEYRLFDKKNVEHWFPGVIHGARRYEDENHIIKKITYLVDTGRDTRVDKYPFDHRDREINKRMNTLLDDDSNDIDTPQKAIAEVETHTDLPKSKQDVEVVRQPEQLELPPENVRSPQK